MNEWSGSAARWLAGLIGLGAISYATYAGATWFRFGKVRRRTAGDEEDPQLDRFIPDYEVRERHHVRVAASAEIALSAAAAADLRRSAIIRAIFKGREVILGAEPETTALPSGLLAETKAMGWGLLAEIPDREIVMGAVTQPWMANAVLRTIPPDEFLNFNEPDYVKIVWTLRADPIGSDESVFGTETRATSTDPAAHAKFRRYWSLFSPGILLIRRISLRLLKREAERRARRQVFAGQLKCEA